MVVSYQTLDMPLAYTYPKGISGNQIVGNYVIGDINEYITQGFLYANNEFTSLVAQAPTKMVTPLPTASTTPMLSAAMFICMTPSVFTQPLL